MTAPPTRARADLLPMTLWRNLVSLASLSVITLNLVLWLFPLSLVALIKLCDVRHRLLPFNESCVRFIYASAVSIHDFWLQRVHGIRFNYDHCGTLLARCIVLSNPRCWFDIFVLQSLISKAGPPLKFLIKKELLYVPLVGMICWVLEFPRLERGSSQSATFRDASRVRKLGENLRQQDTFALMNFVEGTRYAPGKPSPFSELLAPRVGGLVILLDVLGWETPLLDITLYYPQAGLSFWDVLSGRVKRIDATLEVLSAPARDRKSIKCWLFALWERKAKKLEKFYQPELSGGETP